MGIRLCGLALVSALALSGTAVAHDHLPPHAVLVTDIDSGEGMSYATTWTRRAGKYCATVVFDGFNHYGSPPVQWVPGTAIAVRFEKRQRPSRVNVRGFLLGDPTTGTAIYGEVPIPYELRRVDVGGETMWEAALSPPPWPDLYLHVMAVWEDVDGCGKQSARWTFRAGLLPV